jgi:hypothetical protein
MNQLGLRGVSLLTYKKLNKPWIAQITVQSQHIWLGMHATKEEAVKARKDAEVKYFGEYRCTV